MTETSQARKQRITTQHNTHTHIYTLTHKTLQSHFSNKTLHSYIQKPQSHFHIFTILFSHITNAQSLSNSLTISQNSNSHSLFFQSITNAISPFALTLSSLCRHSNFPHVFSCIFASVFEHDLYLHLSHRNPFNIRNSS